MCWVFGIQRIRYGPCPVIKEFPVTLSVQGSCTICEHTQLAVLCICRGQSNAVHPGQSKLCGQAPLKGLETAMNSMQDIPEQSISGVRERAWQEKPGQCMAEIRLMSIEGVRCELEGGRPWEERGCERTGGS